ncbi:MAG TPA: MM0924 family protein [Pyrinomonadaceae bacterium]|jgi:hypothetical protein|nr:MM0924 family protein [Pyrinomonadaceae bacterium]
MKTFLSGFVGKKVDVVCAGGVAVRGEIVSIEDEVLELKDDEDRVCYVSIDKVTVVWETKDHSQRAGFISGFTPKS